MSAARCPGRRVSVALDVARRIRATRALRARWRPAARPGRAGGGARRCRRRGWLAGAPSALAAAAAVAVLAGATLARGAGRRARPGGQLPASDRPQRRRAGDPARAGPDRATGRAVARVRLRRPERSGRGVGRASRARSRSLAPRRPAACRGARSAASCACAGRSRRSARSTRTSAGAARTRSRSRSRRGTRRARARGGLAGALDAARERARARARRRARRAAGRAAARHGARPGRGDRATDVARRLPARPGLAHLLAVSAARTSCCSATLVLAAAARRRTCRCAPASSPRLVLVALYVPLAGGGPSIQRAGVMGVAGLVAALAGRPASRWYALGLAAARHARAQPARRRRARLAALVRRRGGPAGARAAAARRADAPRVPGAASPRPRRSRSRRRSPPRRCWRCTSSRSRSSSLPANLLAAPAVAPVMWLGMLGDRRSARSRRALARAAQRRSARRCSAYLDVGRARAPPRAARGAAVRLPGPAGLALAYARGSPRSSRRSGSGAAAALAAGRRRPLAVASAIGRVRSPRPRSSPRWRCSSASSRCTALGTRCRHARRASSSSRSSTSARATRRCCSATAPRCSSTPGRRAARSCAASPKPASGGSTCSSLTHAEADHEGMALPVIAAHRPRLVLDGGAGWPTRGAARAPGGARARRRRRGRRARGPGAPPRRPLKLRRPLAARAAPGLARRTATRTTARSSRTCATARSTCCCPPTPSPNVTAALDLPRVEALKVAHHGSDDAGLPALLERTAPRVAAIEVGRATRYGHPTPSTLAALRVVPEVVRTDRDGTVRLTSRGGAMRMERGVCGGRTTLERGLYGRHERRPRWVGGDDRGVNVGSPHGSAPAPTFTSLRDVRTSGPGRAGSERPTSASDPAEPPC